VLLPRQDPTDDETRSFAAGTLRYLAAKEVGERDVGVGLGPGASRGPACLPEAATPCPHTVASSPDEIDAECLTSSADSYPAVHRMRRVQVGARDLAQHGGLDALAAALEDPAEVGAANAPRVPRVPFAGIGMCMID
jgi:hypothetical protein